MKKILFLYFLIVSQLLIAQSKLTEFVNPFIGTGGHGHTYPGASLPFGMVQLSPDTRLNGWDGCSGYHYSDSIIYGFSHTHLSGTGVEDYCDILLQPTNNAVAWDNEVYKSVFSHKNEEAHAGFYKVKLDKYNIDVELTSTLRTGVHQYTYPKNSNSYNVLLDLEHRDIVLNSSLKIVDDYTITGLRQSKSWAQNQYVYFAMKFSKPIKSFIIQNGNKINTDKSNQGQKLKAFFTFDLDRNRKLVTQVALSGVDEAGALRNLQAESVQNDFEKAKNNAENQWNTELSKIIIQGGTKDQKIIFYSALYHTLLNPNLYQDVDGQYRGTDLKIHKTDGYSNYSVFSLWDTYRALHPLMTIINRNKTVDWIKTFLDQDEKGGMLPVWELSGNETNCMIGYHSVSVIYDAYKKGITNFNARAALFAMLRYAESKKYGLGQYIKEGYISNDIESESVSKILEYAYDDWCIAMLAKDLGEVDTYSRFIARAQNYKNAFDQKTKFMRGKLGAIWYSPFDPKEINNFFTEGNSWQYSFSVPQDISGMINLYGGKKGFEQKLDELFSTDSKTTGRDQSDVTGLIGQYAHGNEPSHHIAFLYYFLGKPNLTQDKVNQINNNFYRNSPDGLIGNEDCGQMSAWHVLTSIGLYDICPGNGYYLLLAPQFDKVTINLENGKKWVIEVNKESSKSKYIQKIKLNNNNYTLSYLNNSNINDGGKIEFYLGDQPNDWGTQDFSLPFTQIEPTLVRVPYFNTDSKKFRGEKLVEITSEEPDSKLFYAIVKNNIEPKRFEYTEYEKPFYITETCKVYTYCKKGRRSSMFIHQDFFKIPTDRSIKILSKVNPMYTAGGDDALIDGIVGETNYKTGDWQSYEGEDFTAIVDLKEPKQINNLSIHVLQDVGSWIWMPKYVQFYSSDDGVNFKEIGQEDNVVSDKDYKVKSQYLGGKADIKTRFIKVYAKNYGKIPDWHPGKGGKAHLFIDEIIIK